jgi:hypothetical protein
MIAFSPPPSNAEIPQVISYQGKVTDSDGAPIADGAYAMRFTIYDVPTGGTYLWYSGVVNAQVTGGIFNVLLGENPQPAIDLPFDDDYWLNVWIDGDTQTPRQPLGSVGYAYMASGLVPGTEVIGSVATGSLAALKVVNTATSGLPYGIYGEVTGPAGTRYGVFGTTESTHGRGVCGEATATTGGNYGVYGTTASNGGRGLYGEATSTSGSGYGVYGKSLSLQGRGVFGEATQTSGANYGVYGKSSSTNGRGVNGESTATTGSTTGVRGVCSSTSGRGVTGSALATTGSAYGGSFQCDSDMGIGVFASATATTGTTTGVSGKSSSESGTGVYGTADAATRTTYGVYGRTESTSGYGIYYSGGLAGTGSKSCVVKTSQGPTLMYCQESPENWFEDFGEGQLVNGRAHIELDPLFLETVTIDAENPMEVFIQLRDDCRGVYVKAGSSGFDVVELQDGMSDAEFSYRVMAKRRGFESKRLDYCAAAETDSYLYPELR